MIKVENIDVYGFEHAVKAMRNPMSSWSKSDSKWGFEMPENNDLSPVTYYIGDNDLDLMKRLYRAGTEHRTYARMIYVWMDITAPLYLWKEIDRYSVGKSQVSTSTMHKIHAKEFTDDDFSMEHLIEDNDHAAVFISSMHRTIADLNTARELYLKTKDKKWWWQLIQLLPSSYNQKRTVCISYEVVFKIIRERTGHKLDEWNDFVKILRDLPYVKEIIGERDE